MQALTAISPIDGRYRDKVEGLANYFSESALIRYRVMVEVEYFIALCELPLPQLRGFDPALFDSLKEIYLDFTVEDAQKIKDIEKVTNHDVKAVEYFIKERFDALNLHDYKEFIHFGLTSQDINNTAVPCSFRDAIHDVYYPVIDELIAKLEELAEEWKEIPMLAKTHGQPASPTRLGKEIRVFVYRLTKQLELLKKVACSGKFGGATGNFNAHNVAYPEIDWTAFANKFLTEKLKIEREQYTTQISNYDNFAAVFDNLRRLNNIVIDLDRDFWTYISMSYFKQKIKAGEVGSSAMPHKVNPIDFENSEGNLGLANAVLDHLAGKLPISRWQRDLTDSTVLRNLGVAFGYCFIGYNALTRGLGKLQVNEQVIAADLDNAWEVLAEAVQTVMRRYGVPHPYEQLKALTRGKDGITKETMREFISNLDIPADAKASLMELTPATYIGKAVELARRC